MLGNYQAPAQAGAFFFPRNDWLLLITM